MKILTNYEGKWREKDSLWDAFCLNEKIAQKKEEGKKQAYTIAFVGGGGKTSSIYRLAAEGVKRGKKVIIMTTTHMLTPREYAVFLKNGQMDFEQVRKKLLEDGVVIVGDKISEKKISFVGDEIYREFLEMAELILVEADGSRHLPIKVPVSHEPVIPSKVDEIVCVCGLSCYGKKAEEVCFRLEQARKIRDRYKEDNSEDREWTIKKKDVMNLMREGFLKPLRAKEKNAKISMMLTQADTRELEEIGRYLLETMNEVGIVIRKLPLMPGEGGKIQ